MNSIAALQQEIIRLKKEKDVCILAHAYQSQAVLEVADFVGDSYGLSKQAMNAPQQTILMCGVRFMAETAKILSPDKKVLLSHPDAGCPMAEQFSVAELRAFKAQNPDSAVVCYVNTTAALKAECDVCVTSASAIKVVSALPQKNILFIPDCNLGAWVAENVKDKNFTFINGGCPVHKRITAADVAAAKAAYPNAELLVHPETLPEVSGKADYVGSTTGIMAYAAESDKREFIIGTDNSIVEHLQFAHPEKRFYPLSKKCICEDMRLTTLGEINNTLTEGGTEITLPADILAAARNCIDKMLTYGN